MKEIFAYVGSRMEGSSKTFQYVKSAINNALKLVGDYEVKVNIYTAADLNIKFCRGCLNCFVNGICYMDNEDDMKIIKDKILSADIIILASPVYVHHISGDMKVFLDRLGYWCHLLRLAGKPGIAVATSGGNGLDLTYNYLYKVMSYLGIKVVGKFGIAPYKIDEEYLNSVENCSKVIAD
ncbi:flavodoxin family protein [Clostridium sp. BL8]|nr:flavodoxin family protein [Clostridium sp. BL8]